MRSRITRRRWSVAPTTIEGAALAYYGSRGETPLRWGGAGAARLGLSGEVTPGAYEAAFGSGGFRVPSTGMRLVETRRPGFELVVSAHKSVAVLGVIGNAEQMHSILDVETAATMDWLDEWFQERGGRRGRAQTRTATGGLDVCRDASRDVTGRGSLPARSCPGREPGGDARRQRRFQGVGQCGAAGHGRSGHDDRAARIRRRGRSSWGSTSKPMTARRGICGTGASSAFPTRCVSCSRSGPTTSPSISPAPASTATGPAGSQPGRPGR